MESLISLFEHFKLKDKSAIQLNKEDPDYILDFSYQERSEDPLIAAACSNFSIKLMSRLRLATVCTLLGHKDTITKVQFGKTDDNLIFSCSRDKTIRCWDIRAPSDKETQIFSNSPGIKSDFLCLDISQTDRLLCAGTELDNNDSFLLFWDRRCSGLLGCYRECHQGDVTQVSFQPGSDQYMASGSADGLVCTFDLNEACEDDALQLTCNAMSDVSRVGWCGPNRKEYIYCVTSDYNVQVWDSEEGESCNTLTDFSIELDISSDYIVDCIPDMTALDDQHTIVLIAGDHSGNLQLASFNETSSKILASLNGGHTATVRCSHWDPKTQTLLTGGEDSLVCLWSAAASTETFQDKGSKSSLIGKIKEKSKAEDRKPYSKKPK
ncbi:WD repeat-containing protein 89 [Biomphalaria glabrata]|uniref:WD repeat-containing protein 89 n=1 Tax=Biomphalaria glabrata TaxID=6526 RepID=A0A9W3AZA2_BIOGL|nr:WD repeat-containing protein 89-like [Biomphalaria glabrata]KAI8762722.1 WD repeat-containing protein 89-like [Biomphalaria glabrata]